MKRGLRAVGPGIAFALIAVLGLLALIRLAPADVAVWHVRPAHLVPEEAGWDDWVLYPPTDTDGPRKMPGGAYAATFIPAVSSLEVLARLDAVALASPRTRRIAGSPETGMITWETRSAVWGFPDYTTAEAEMRDPGKATFGAAKGVMLYLVARQRFGTSDFGVNAARLTGWLAGL